MKTKDVNTVYILSGPAGVGKSTISERLAEKLKSSAYISGDYISYMHINGREKPWESKREHSLIWNNILSLSENFLNNGIDVVIDYVAFPRDAEWLRNNLKELDAEVRYVVLWTDKDTLIERDSMRKPEQRMGERCLALIDEFLESGLDDRRKFDTSNNTPQDIPKMLEEIMQDPRFRTTF